MNEYAIRVLKDTQDHWQEGTTNWKELQSAIEKLQADEEVIELCEKCMAKRITKLSENGGIPI